MDRSVGILHEYWGFEKFRPMQQEIVDSALYGHDTFAILPTGGGKSICFQVPGLGREGVTIVISPLIALMQDQVNNLKKKGIKAEFLSSNMNYKEIDITLDNVRFGNIKFLYTSPERLKTSLFLERFKRMNVGLLVVDEAHCISEWGHDFRPAYREIAAIRNLHPEVPMIALTASATPEVQEDIIQLLALRSPKIFRGDVKRSNISYRAVHAENKQAEIVAFCRAHATACGIVYCQTRKSVKEMARLLHSHGIAVGMYHGGMTKDDRSYMLESWMQNRVKVMVSTNAFGMGIDKADVRFVLHYEIPGNLEAYYQEAGRAGRDEKEAVAIAYWNEQDLVTLDNMLQSKYPEKERIKQIYDGVGNYLNVAYGSGVQETYPLDISAFSKKFGFSVSEAFNALKVLELNGNLVLSEGGFLPTRLKFNIGSSELYRFQVGHESLAALITQLTRSYPGIFDQFIAINEKELIKRLQITSGALRNQFQALETFGIIEIRLQSELPQLTYLTPRLSPDQLSIAAAIYENRKRVETLQLVSMTEFIQSDQCRSSLISAYFNAATEACGKCDNCIRKQQIQLTDREIASQILAQLPASLNQLRDLIPTEVSRIEKAIRSLILEEKIRFNQSLYEIIP